MKEEFEVIYDSLFRTGLGARYYIDMKDIKCLNNQIRNCKDELKRSGYGNEEMFNYIVNDFEAPDFYLKLDNYILGVEHFMIDQSKLTKKGYRLKRKYCERYFEEIHSEIKKDNSDKNVSQHLEKISVDLKYKYLYQNLTRSFMNHYNKIEKYKENIRNEIDTKNKEIIIIFLIQYDSMIPSSIFHEGEEKFIYPHNDIKFYEFLKNKSDLKGVILYENRINTSNINQYVSIDSVKEENYNIEDSKIFDLSRMHINDYQNPFLESKVFKI